MLYFLVKKGNELHIMRIAPHYEEFFRLFYHDQLIVEGSSVEDVLLKFHQLPLTVNEEFC